MSNSDGLRAVAAMIIYAEWGFDEGLRSCVIDLVAQALDGGASAEALRRLTTAALARADGAVAIEEIRKPKE